MPPGARAENNPISFQEAQAIFDELIKQYEIQTGTLDLELHSTMAKSRCYERKSRGKGMSDFNLDKPTTEVGVYLIDYAQRFHGIPYIVTAAFDIAYQVKERMDIPDGQIFGWIASKDDYLFRFDPCVEVGILMDAIPLVAFAEVKKEFEKLIKAGLIREVFDIRLAYYFYIDSENPGETFVLQPVWLLRGSIVEKASFPDPEPLEFAEEYSRKYGGQHAIVEAFSGERLGERPGWNYADTSLWK
jgi:hypothetical protein